MSARRAQTPATSRTPLLSPARAFIALILMVAIVASGTSGGWRLESRGWLEKLLGGEPMPTTNFDPPTQPPPLAALSPLQHWIAGVLTVLVGLAVLVVLIYLGRWLWRQRPRRAVAVEGPPDTTPAGALAGEPDIATLVRGAEAAESILTETGGEPRELILRCWLALEEAAAASGAARRPSDSPTEFTGVVLHATQADPASVDALLRLYHQARFSRHPISDDDVRSARTAVIKLARIWRSFDTAMRHTAQDQP